MKRYREKVLGKEDPSYNSVLTNLGALYLKMGNYRKAEAFFLETISIQIEEKTQRRDSIKRMRFTELSTEKIYFAYTEKLDSYFCIEEFQFGRMRDFLGQYQKDIIRIPLRKLIHYSLDHTASL